MKRNVPRAAAKRSPTSYRTLPGISTRPGFSEAAGDPRALAQFVDREMKSLLDEKRFAGAAVALVKGKEIVFLGDYGFADAERKVRVDARRTLFQVGSVSKLLTFTAVMQMVEKEQLSLTADVNSYLDFELPTSGFGPITLKHLLTHTAGFESTLLGYQVAVSEAAPASLRETLVRHMPARVLPPLDDFAAFGGHVYSNWCGALAGHIVSERSGVPFDDYIKANVLEPLDMRDSTFCDPVPETLRPQVAVGYALRLEGGKPVFEPQHAENYHGIGPAGSLRATVRDMACFMIAQLNDGKFEERRILKSGTVRQMHDRAYGPCRYTNGSTLGFAEQFINGRRVLLHGGATTSFRSELHLIPEFDLGLFVAYNTVAKPGATGVRTGHLILNLLDEFFPDEIPDLAPTHGAHARIKRYVGRYRYAHRFRTWEKFMLGMATLEVAPTGHGALNFPGPASKDAPVWIEVPRIPGLFRREDRDMTMAFFERPDGNTYFLGETASWPGIKARFFETPEFTDRLLNALSGIFGATTLAALAIFVFSLAGIAACLAASLLCLVNLAVVQCLKDIRNRDPHTMLSGLPPVVFAAMALGVVSAVLTAAYPLLITLAWPSSNGSLLALLCAATSWLLAVAFVLWLHFWNLLGFRIA